MILLLIINILSDRELIELLVGLKRIDILKAIAAKRVEELKLGDAIEVHLYYQVKLKDALRLPLSTSERCKSLMKQNSKTLISK